MHYSKLEAYTAIPRLIKSINQSGNKGDAHGVSLCWLAIFRHAYREAFLEWHTGTVDSWTNKNLEAKVGHTDQTLLFLFFPKETKLGSMGYFDRIMKWQEKLK